MEDKYMAVDIVYEHIFYDNGHNSHVATYSLSVTMETGHMQTIAFHGITKHTGSKTNSILFLLIAICLCASQLLTTLKTLYLCCHATVSIRCLKLSLQLSECWSSNKTPHCVSDGG